MQPKALERDVRQPSGRFWCGNGRRDQASVKQSAARDSQSARIRDVEVDVP